MPANDNPGFDLTIIRITPRRHHAGGLHVTGTIDGFRFGALVFPEHAENPIFELGESRISKLSLHRVGDPHAVFNFDRGHDVPPADPEVRRVVQFLEHGLADYAFAVQRGRRLVAGDTTAVTTASRTHPEFTTALEAIRYARDHRPVAVTVDGRYLVVSQADADRMQAAGVEFACLTEYDGRIVTVPIN